MRYWPLAVMVLIGAIVWRILNPGTISDALYSPVAGDTARQVETSHTFYGGETLRRAFRDRSQGMPVEGAGIVIRLLADDNDGSRHQRFIIRMDTGQTVLIAHNIDIAPRIDTLWKDDFIEFKGEYEWNPKGGVLHWTHHDPAGQHPGGWIKHKGRKYE